jgi:tetratricopeptide (TPR) repeat protein
MSNGFYQHIEDAIERIREGKVEEGLSTLTNLLQYGKDNPDLLYELAEVFYDLGHVDTSLSLLHDLEQYHDQLGTDDVLQARALQAEILIDLGELDQAMDLLMSCLDIDTEYSQACILLADIFLMQNLPEVAVRYLEKVLEQDPDQVEVRYILSEVLVDLGEVKQAEEHWHQLAETKYEDKVLISKAMWLSQTGRFEEAFSLYKNCLASESTNDALFGCLVTSSQLGEYDQAVYYGEQLLEADPEYTGGVQALCEALKRNGQIERAEDILRQSNLRQ